MFVQCLCQREIKRIKVHEEGQTVLTENDLGDRQGTDQRIHGLYSRLPLVRSCKTRSLGLCLEGLQTISEVRCGACLPAAPGGVGVDTISVAAQR